MEFYYGEYNPKTHEECPAVRLNAKTLTGAKREAARRGTEGFPQAIGLSVNSKGYVADYLSRRWNYKGEPWTDEKAFPAWARMETAEMHITPQKMQKAAFLGEDSRYDELSSASFSPFRGGHSPLLVSVSLTLCYQEKTGFFVKISQHELQAYNGKWHGKQMISNSEDYYFLGSDPAETKKTKIKYGYYFQRFHKELLNLYVKDHHLEEICPDAIV